MTAEDRIRARAVGIVMIAFTVCVMTAALIQILWLFPISSDLRMYQITIHGQPYCRRMTRRARRGIITFWICHRMNMITNIRIYMSTAIIKRGQRMGR